MFSSPRLLLAFSEALAPSSTPDVRARARINWCLSNSFLRPFRSFVISIISSLSALSATFAASVLNCYLASVPDSDHLDLKGDPVAL